MKTHDSGMIESLQSHESNPDTVKLGFDGNRSDVSEIHTII